METKEKISGKDVSMAQFTNNLYTNMMELMRSINKFWAIVKAWQEASWQRKELINLSDHLLKDIGISREEAQREANRYFWDLGPNRDSLLRNRQNSNLIQSGNEAFELCST